MRSNHFRAVESLEVRRLFVNTTLLIDESVSNITAAGTVNAVPLSENVDGSLTATIGGTVDVSTTRRGIKFQGSDITITPAVGPAFSFAVTPSGPFVDVSDLNFDLTSPRLGTTGNKFSVANITLDTTAGEVAVTGLGSNVDLSGTTVTIDYAIGRIKKNADAIRVTVPFSFSVTGNYTLASVPQTLDLTFDGIIVARNVFASPSAFVASKSTVVTEKQDRVADGVIG